MISSKCTHLRIRDSNDYNIKVEKLIESIEKEFRIDFRTLPRWEELVQRLHVAATDYKRKIQDANLRKSTIIDKLHMEMTRPSPFELTSGLCRTANKWRQTKTKRKVQEISEVKDEELLSIKPEVVSDVIDSLHPNTEIATNESPFSEADIVVPNKEVVSQVGSYVKSSHLPIFICTNLHKLLSPLNSRFSQLTYKSLVNIVQPTRNKEGELNTFKLTSSVICTPSPITITSNSLKQQCVQFTVTNCASEYQHIRFKCLLDYSPFKKIKVLPAFPKRLYPGIAVVYKFIFKLKNEAEFTSCLYFKVGRDVIDNAPTEAFYVPITSDFTKMRSVTVSDTTILPPVYPWHIKRNSMYSTGIVKISVNDNYSYHLHIHKKNVDLSRDSDILRSVQASGPNTASIVERTVITDVDVKTIVSSSKGENPQIESKCQSLNDIDVMALIIDDIIEFALEALIFESTYLYLAPYAKANIPVYLTKAEHIGYHQNYYDFELVDPETEKVMMTKTVKIFAEVLPHPIQIKPLILDMSNSPITHGFCEDHFVITNSHNQYTAYIKIKLSTKMKKMFLVEPMETAVLTRSSVPFAVKFCSRDLLSQQPCEDLVHFTFKIVVSGYKAVFQNVPPVFYEIIIPCAGEFKRVYNEKYFKEDMTL